MQRTQRRMETIGIVAMLVVAGVLIGESSRDGAGASTGPDAEHGFVMRARDTPAFDRIAQAGGLSDSLKQAAGVGVGTAADEAAAGATMGAAATKGGAAAVNSAVGAQTAPSADSATGAVSDSLKQAAGVGVGTAADEAAAGATMGTAATKGGAAAVNSALGAVAPPAEPPATE